MGAKGLTAAELGMQVTRGRHGRERGRQVTAAPMGTFSLVSTAMLW